MNSNPAPTPINAGIRAQIKPMEVTISGRIEEVQRFEGIYATRIITPAPDEYSSPQNVKVRSKTRIGSRDELVTITARLGGYKRKPFKATDKESGEIVNVIPVDMTLDLVD